MSTSDVQPVRSFCLQLPQHSLAIHFLVPPKLRQYLLLKRLRHTVTKVAGKHPSPSVRDGVVSGGQWLQYSCHWGTICAFRNAYLFAVRHTKTYTTRWYQGGVSSAVK